MKARVLLATLLVVFVLYLVGLYQGWVVPRVTDALYLVAMVAFGYERARMSEMIESQERTIEHLFERLCDQQDSCQGALESTTAPPVSDQSLP